MVTIRKVFFNDNIWGPVQCWHPDWVKAFTYQRCHICLHISPMPPSSTSCSNIQCRAQFTKSNQYNELELQFKSISSNFIGWICLQAHSYLAWLCLWTGPWPCTIWGHTYTHTHTQFTHTAMSHLWRHVGQLCSAPAQASGMTEIVLILQNHRHFSQIQPF